jgi:predicted MFS family arabinose efflux permease
MVERQRGHLPSAFQRLAWSNLLAQSAEQIALAAAPLVAVIRFGAGAAETGLLQTFLTLPFVLFAIPAGLLADRFRRGHLMAVAEAVRTVALVLIVVLLAADLLDLIHLGVLGFVAVCGTVVFSVAAPALVPSLVDKEGLPAANARLELARTMAFAGGPAVGGVLVGWVGPAVAFAAAAALSLIAALLLSRIQETPPGCGSNGSPLQAIREGVAFVARHRLLAPVFVTQTLFNTGFFMIFAVLVPHTVETLGLSPDGVGLMLGCYGVGMVVGALVSPAVMRRVPFGLVIGLGPVCGLVAALLMALTVRWPSPIVASLALLKFGLGPIVWVVSTATLRQSVTPPALLGRVSAINILAYGAPPLGSAVGAGIAAVAGVEACFWAASLMFAAQAATILLSPVIRLEERPEIA